MELVAIYKVWKLGRQGNGFNSDHKLEVVDEARCYEIEYAESMNYNCAGNGRWFEKDEELTKELYETGDINLNKKEESKEDLIAKYEELSGEKAKPIWGVKKLNEEIAKLNK